MGVLEEKQIIQPSCNAEFLMNPNWKSIINKIANCKRSISFATKMNFGDEDIDILKGINERLIKDDQILNVGVTIIKLYDYEELEPFAPDVYERIDLLKRLFYANIACNVIIRPLFPNLKLQEIAEIIRLTKDYCYGYLVGPLYLNENIKDYLRRNNVEIHSEIKCPEWNKFLPMEVIYEKELMNEIENIAKQSGKKVFYSNEECVLFIRDEIFKSSILRS